MTFTMTMQFYFLKDKQRRILSNLFNIFFEWKVLLIENLIRITRYFLLLKIFYTKVLSATYLQFFRIFKTYHFSNITLAQKTPHNHSFKLIFVHLYRFYLCLICFKLLTIVELILGVDCMQLSGQQCELGNQRVSFRVWLLAMCSRELSEVIAQLMSKCI